MTSSDTRAYWNTLTRLASRLRKEVNNLRSEAFAPPVGIGAIPGEQADIAGHEAEDRRVRTVLANEESILDEVEAALDRIEQGSFGRCTKCMRLIRRERLEAIPYARHCVTCAVLEEGTR